MPKKTDGKRNLLIILKALMNGSDERNRMGANDLIQAVEDQGGVIERKAVYRDIGILKDMDFDILYDRTAPAGWYMGSRDFELPELKLLVDAVQASKFITEGKSRELIDKLGRLTSTAEAEQLRRQVYVTDQVKTGNEHIFYNVDTIQEALSADRQIEFTYYQWDENRELVPRNGGKPYIQSPWALTWDNENYYLMAYDAAAGIVKHYRVDKMKNIRVLDKSREGRTVFEKIDMEGFAKRTFGMFGGSATYVTLTCENRFMGVMMDRFGGDAIYRRPDQQHFSITVEVTVSGQFFGWLVGLGPGVSISEPEDVRDEFLQRLREMME